MSLALVVTDRSVDFLVKALLEIQPSLNLQVWPNISNPETVTFAALWKQPKGLLKSFTSLKAVTSTGAGLDFILVDKDLSEATAVSRIVTPGLQQQMAQYVLAYILQDYRQLSLYQKQQTNHLWQVVENLENPTIGFLGFGKIAKYVAVQCQQIGFNVVAYTHRSIDKNFTCLQGESGLQQVMETCDYIVCLLPLTKATKGILNTNTFSYCKKKPLLIQVGRGEQLVEKDLLESLDKNLIKHAVLDVFATEPLPSSHQFWKRKDITITPHNSARSDNKQTAKEIIRRYNQCLEGKPLDLEIKT